MKFFFLIVLKSIRDALQLSYVKKQTSSCSSWYG